LPHQGRDEMTMVRAYEGRECGGGMFLRRGRRFRSDTMSTWERDSLTYVGAGDLVHSLSYEGSGSC